MPLMNVYEARPALMRLNCAFGVQPGVSEYTTLNESPSAVFALQLVDGHLPETGAGFGVGCWLLHPAPEIVAERLPLIDALVTVPVVDALIVQLLHERAGKEIEYAPALDTVVVPDPVTSQRAPGVGIPMTTE